ncbi:MAG: hypothetical protein J6W60_04725 [Treponema sp.]|nr:hypothetical protein [Treponema sp.]
MIYRCWIIDIFTEEQFWSRDFTSYEDAEIFGKEQTSGDNSVSYDIEEITKED